MKKNVDKIIEYLDECLDKCTKDDIKSFSAMFTSGIKCNDELDEFVRGKKGSYPPNYITMYDILQKLVDIISDGEESIYMIEHDCAPWILYFENGDDL